MEARVGIEPALTELQNEPLEDDLFFKYRSLLEILSSKPTPVQFS